MSTKRLGTCLLALATASTPLAVACSSSNSPHASSDAGITLHDDGGSAPRDAGADVGSTIDVGSVPMTGEADRSDPGAYATGCLDGLDQNMSGAADCSDPTCSASPSCCVGRTSSDCCLVPGAAIDLHFVCASGGGACDALVGATPFGDVGPVRTIDGAFAPESDHGTDSGAIFADAIDPRAARVTIDASLAVPSATTADGTDAIGVGLVSAGASAHVVPLAAIVVSAARGQVLLLLGDSVAGVATAPTDGDFHDYSLSLGPDGQVSATFAGTTLSASVPLPSTSLHAAFFGRATNPGSLPSGLPARIGSLSVGSSGCDQPTALTRVGAIDLVDETGAVLLDTVESPHVASDGTTTVLVFSAMPMGGGGSAIFVATRDPDGSFHVRAPTTGSQPILAPDAGDALESPAIAASGGTWTLYGTRLHAGVRSIFVSRSSSSDPLGLATPMDVVIPGLSGDVGSPAIVPGNVDQIVVRHQASAGDIPLAAEFVLADLAPASGVATPSADICAADSPCAGGTRGDANVYAARTSTVRFDADDVDDPAIVLYDHVYRLYYAGRLGSRWSIGMLIAADLGYWRAANDGDAILGPDGNGLDAVSVRDPAPIVENGALSLYYVGSDGDTRTIALAQGASVIP
jgi:hypothetical protein